MAYVMTAVVVAVILTLAVTPFLTMLELFKNRNKPGRPLDRFSDR